jgi:hypothetical protein
MAAPCKKCNGSGQYRRGSFKGFCYACNGRGIIKRTRRPSVARIEQRLANLQDEKKRLAESSEADLLEYDKLVEEAERCFAPVRDICGVPTSINIAQGYIEQAVHVRESAMPSKRRNLKAMRLFGPLSKPTCEIMERSLQEFEADIKRLRLFLDSLPEIAPVLARKEELFARLQRVRNIEYSVTKLQEELISAERQPEVKIQKLRSRVALSDRENREAVERFRSELARTEHCPYCDAAIVEFHLDHIIPVSYGGNPCRENLVWVCAPCNLKKRDLTLLEFSEKFELDYLCIVRRLRALGKRA